MTAVQNGGPDPSTRRARGRDTRRATALRWRRFGVAVAVTVVLIAVFGALPGELGGTRPGAVPAAAVSAVGDDTPVDDAPHRPPRRRRRRPRPPPPWPPTTTTEAPKLRAPGLGLPEQPEPTPVDLPPTGQAPVFSRIPTTNKVIFLGIDDGLVRDPAVADLLKQANVPFTMFLVQGEAEAGADYFRQLQEYGGIVEAHTITHPDLTTLSYGQVQTEVCGVLDDFQTLFGRRPTLFRSPYGNTTRTCRPPPRRAASRRSCCGRARPTTAASICRTGPSSRRVTSC